MNKTNKQLFYFIAGEASGDLHGANLIEQLKKQTNFPLEFRGLGGPKMIKNGLTPVENFERLAVMGFYEVLKNLLFFFKLKRKVMQDIIEHQPSKIILIDYPGFNLKIAESIKKNTKINTKIYYYISPQLWAWKENRLNNIKKYVDEMIVLFPFEVEWYQKRGFSVQYFGHPLLDNYSKTTFTKNDFTNLTIGFFPGSRNQEIKKHLPIMQNIINELDGSNSGSIKGKSLAEIDDNLKINIVVGVVDNKENYVVNPMFFSKKWNIHYVQDSFGAFEKSDVAIVASGTATLECAITETPMVVIYKMSQISWWLTKFFIKVPFASIVNILAREKLSIVSEYLQGECDDRRKIALEIKNLLFFDIKTYRDFYNSFKISNDSSSKIKLSSKDFPEYGSPMIFLYICGSLSSISCFSITHILRISSNSSKLTNSISFT